MIYKKHVTVTLLFILLASFSFAQTFMVLEKMGTKKRYIYYIGQKIEYQLIDQKSYDRNLITTILDSAFVSRRDTIPFSSIHAINIKNKRNAGIINTAGPTLIIAGASLLAIDAINRGLIQEGGYTWDTGIGTASTILVTIGALIMVLKKDRIILNNKGWWRLRKADIY